VQSLEGITSDLYTKNMVKENYEETILLKSVDKYQEFGYPILVDDIMCIIS